MKQKKIMMVLLFILIFTLIVSFILIKNPTNSQTLALKDETPKTELTILEAIKLAYPSALEWNKDAQLLQGVNIDRDKPGKSIGSNGKRKYWNIDFGVPDTNKIFLVTIHEGKIVEAKDMGREGDSPYSKDEFIKLEDINYDSPQLLKKAKELGDIHAGKDWAKGYNFIIRKDSETKLPLILVIGWNVNNKKMVAVYFNATNGKHLVTSK
ncbi:hypothetical protein [Bacillus pseudomycoides]|uniref:hypothetical protein n=1 Tax=Bacillus pseudomycoides TaxID=64104 RepID=UPI000BF4C010|nr:hypothetical protein [Bacillus pseudomycoides]PFX55037.1 hypothetical protein COL31_10800 [Bacillus pseudomycoides]PFZ83136.1 hypothetical protein COL69_11980 [Bacillus pseudomycoides]PGE12003.1 hypothetical protein COM51_24080 [Bacillus pseudomycoides]